MDGGPAFPSAALPDATDERNFQRDGMSLRDWFAGQALVALMSNPGWVKGLDEVVGRAGCSFKASLAANVYAVADAMLAERTKKDQS